MRGVDAVQAQAADKDGVLTRSVERGRVIAAVKIVYKGAAGRGGNGGSGLRERDGILRAERKRDGVRARDRHAHAGAVHAQAGQVQDFAPFVLHFHLLGRVAVLQARADVRDAVVSNRAREGRGTRSFSRALRG